jgi:hypothetical protein
MVFYSIPDGIWLPIRKPWYDLENRGMTKYALVCHAGMTWYEIGILKHTKSYHSILYGFQILHGYHAGYYLLISYHNIPDTIETNSIPIVISFYMV